MTNIYNLLREACGISQLEAAELVHDTRLDTVKSWCNGRRPAPIGVVDELRELVRDIEDAATDLFAQLKPEADGAYSIGVPADERAAASSGFPIGAALRATALAIARLPAGAGIHLEQGGRGLPTVRRRKNKKPDRASQPGRATS